MNPAVREENGLVELTSPLPETRYVNNDIAPTNIASRTWNFWHIAALWIGMSVCIPTYNIGGSLIDQGMNWKQAFITVLLGNIIVLVPMILNAVPGTRYGIPFPVLVRSSFGIIGSNIPAILRALVACGWFGIQTWIGGTALYEMMRVIWPGISGLGDMPAWIGINIGQFFCFMLFWAWNVYHVLAGMESIKWMETLAAPFLIAIGLGFLWWAYSTAGGWGPVLSAPARFGQEGFAPTFGNVFWPSLTAMVGFWATLSLNIPDFSRFARSQKDQFVGQTLGLPTTMGLYAFIGIAVTSATVLIFGQPIWNPIKLIGAMADRGMAGGIIVAISAFTMAVATLSTNIAANVVSPANDFANLAPRLISFKTGGMITALLGILMMPWKLISSTQGYIFTWLIGYSALMGGIAGVMIADYFVVRRGKLVLADLYRDDGVYSRWRWQGITAFAAGVIPNLPGFLVQAGFASAESVPDFFESIYPYSWFIGFGISFVLYYILCLGERREA